MSEALNMLTVGMIADRLGVSRDQVAYVLRTRRIPAAGRLGNYRVFDLETIETVERELRAIASGRYPVTADEITLTGAAK